MVKTASEDVGRPGRKRRGDRKTIIPGFPVAHLRWYNDHADARRLGFSEYACAELARAHGLQVPDYIRELKVVAPVHDQLPFDQVAAGTKRATIRVPTEHYLVYLAKARELAVPLADYVRRILAERHGLVVDPYEGGTLLSA